MDRVLTLILLFILPLLAVVVWIVSSRGIPLYTKVQEAQDILVRKVQEFMGGVRVIKALSKTDYERSRYDEINREVVNRDFKAGVVMSITNSVMNLFLNCGLAAVILVGAYRVNAGVTQPGTLIAFLTYFTIILNAMMGITRLFTNLSRGMASANRIDEVLSLGPKLTIGEKNYKETDALVSFENVSFSYNGISDDVSDISFELKAGETLGIIGPTGSGKTTVINLLMRFYDPGSGLSASTATT